MAQTLAQITFVVREYDEAIAFFTGKPGFHLVEDTVLGDGKRWVVVKPDGPGGIRIRLLLAQASTPEQFRSVGNQTGGRVFLFLESPREEPYGTVAVFEDLYNKWDLLMPSRVTRSS